MKNALLPLVLLAPLVLFHPNLAASTEGDEVRAQRLLDRIRTETGREKFQDAWKHLGELRADYGETEAVAAAAEELSLLRLTLGLEVVGGAIGLAAEVRTEKGGALLIEYDLDSSEARKDFRIQGHLPSRNMLIEEERVLRGTGAWCHRAVFLGDLKIEVTGEPHNDRNVGLLFLDPDEDQPRFVVGAIENTFFATMYGSGAIPTLGDAIYFCGRGAESLDTVKPVELLSSGRSSGVTRGKTLTISFEWSGSKLRLVNGDAHLAASAGGKDKQMNRKWAGVHLYDSAFRPSRVVIQGRLDPEWSAREAERVRRRIEERKAPR